MSLFLSPFFSGLELLQAGSVSLFLGPSDGLHSHSLLLDEERGRLLLGTRDHIYLLDPDNLAKAPRKVMIVMCKEDQKSKKKTNLLLTTYYFLMFWPFAIHYMLSQ